MGTGPAVAILVLTLVHFGAFGLLFWHLAGREIFSVFRIAPGPSSSGGGGAKDPVPSPDPRGDRDGGIPLPDAAPAPVRLREPGRIADGYPRRERRPVHEPAPRPVRRPAERP
ncbi:MAG TPA: hypothetical protein VF549_12440 [Solirubrobacteraceae bacterium]|jgi:hypothetical protein